jgi:hypothetical protein
MEDFFVDDLFVFFFLISKLTHLFENCGSKFEWTVDFIDGNLRIRIFVEGQTREAI